MELGTPFDTTTIKTLNSQKSNFLILPEYFYIEQQTKNLEDLQNISNRALLLLTKLSESYRGIVIGGSFIFEKDKQKFLGIPVLKGGQIIDWQTKQKLTKEEKKLAIPGKGDSIFILDNIRFAVSFYADLSQTKFLENLKAQDIRTLFCIGSFTIEDMSRETLSKELQTISQSYNINIILCSSFGKAFYAQKPLVGCSQVVTPFGVSWQVSDAEANKEILKTIVLNHPEISF